MHTSTCETALDNLSMSLLQSERFLQTQIVRSITHQDFKLARLCLPRGCLLVIEAECITAYGDTYVLALTWIQTYLLESLELLVGAVHRGLHIMNVQLFFFNDTATTDIYTISHTLSLHDALPIYSGEE